MPRKLKPYPVSTGRLPDGSAMVVYLDRDAKTFFVDVLGERVYNAAAEACEHAAIQRWKELAEIDWRKVIVVDMRQGAFNRDGLSLTHRVHIIGRSPGGHWMERPSADAPFTTRYNGPTQSGESEGRYVLPWSAQTEAAVVEIERRLEVLRDRLHALLGDERAPELLAAAVPIMLPAAHGGDDAV